MLMMDIPFLGPPLYCGQKKKKKNSHYTQYETNEIIMMTMMMSKSFHFFFLNKQTLKLNSHNTHTCVWIINHQTLTKKKKRKEFFFLPLSSIEISSIFGSCGEMGVMYK